MSREGVEAKKRRADQLVESYGVLRLASRFEEAVEHLNQIWELDPIDFQILLPGRSVTFSSSLKKAASFVGSSGRNTATTIIAGHSAEVAKTVGDMSTKTAAAMEKVGIARTALNTVGKAGVEIVRKNKYTAIAAGAATAATGFGLGFALKRDLRNFNLKCYQFKLASLDSGEGT